jgi:DNA-directed RNA polymerase specialized sigma24 family protein
MLPTWLHRILHTIAVDQSRRRRNDSIDVSDDFPGRVEML